MVWFAVTEVKVYVDGVPTLLPSITTSEIWYPDEGVIV